MDTSNFYVAIVEDKEKGLFRLPYIVDENPEEIENPDAIVDLAGGIYRLCLKKPRDLCWLNQKKSKKDWEKSKYCEAGGGLVPVMAGNSFEDAWWRNTGGYWLCKVTPIPMPIPG